MNCSQCCATHNHRHTVTVCRYPITPISKVESPEKIITLDEALGSSSDEKVCSDSTHDHSKSEIHFAPNIHDLSVQTITLLQETNQMTPFSKIVSSEVSHFTPSSDYLLPQKSTSMPTFSLVQETRQITPLNELLRSQGAQNAQLPNIYLPPKSTSMPAISLIHENKQGMSLSPLNELTISAGSKITPLSKISLPQTEIFSQSPSIIQKNSQNNTQTKRTNSMNTPSLNLSLPIKNTEALQSKQTVNLSFEKKQESPLFQIDHSYMNRMANSCPHSDKQESNGSLSLKKESSTPPQFGNKSEPHKPTLPTLNNRSQTQNSKRKDFFSKKINNNLIYRTDVIGNLTLGLHEFDDYFGVHVNKFFTPELAEISIYHCSQNIYGTQFVYRDPWGTNSMEKETYKGILNMPKNIPVGSYSCSTLKLEFDEYLKELYVDGNDQITYFRLVTSAKQILEIGTSENKSTLKNIIQPLTRIMGIGGSFDGVLNSVYFYYH